MEMACVHADLEGFLSEEVWRVAIREVGLGEVELDGGSVPRACHVLLPSLERLNDGETRGNERVGGLAVRPRGEIAEEHDA